MGKRGRNSRPKAVSKANRKPASKRRIISFGKIAGGFITGVLVPLVIYTLTASATDIRLVCGEDMQLEKLDVKYYPETGRTDLYYRLVDTFKNVSSKEGHIEKVEFTPLEINVRPEIEVTHVDKESFGWGEQRKVEIRFVIHLTKEMSDTMAQQRKQMAMTMKAYDNTGKSLKVCSSEGAYYRTINLSVP